MSAEPPSSAFLELPSHVIIHVLRQLPLRSIVATALTSWAWHSYVKQTLVNYDTLDDMDAFPPKVMKQVVCWAAAPGNLERLTSLSVSGDLFASIVDDLLVSDPVQPVWPHLLVLKIDSCKALSKLHVAKLLAACPAIASLDLRSCQNLSDSSLELIADHLPQLVALNCSNWFHVSTEGIKYLATHCPKLESLVLDGCPHVASAGLVAIANHCKGLKAISTVKCVRVGNKVMEAFGTHPALEQAVFKMCPKVRDVGLLGRVAPLRMIDISGCPLVTDMDIQQLLHNTGESLEELYLAAGVNLTGQVLPVIGQLARRLRVLRLARVPMFNPDLAALAQHCSSLRDVGIEWCSRITDPGVTQLVAANAHLERISLEGVYLITDAVLEALAQHCRQLREASLRLCNRLTHEGLVQFARSCPALRVLRLGGIMDDASTIRLVRTIRRDCPHLEFRN